MEPVILADIDGTLVDSSYDLAPVYPRIVEAMTLGASLVLATTKTLDEVLLYLDVWDMPRRRVYVVAEAGGLIAGYDLMDYDYMRGDYRVLELGERLEERDLAVAYGLECGVRGYRDMRIDEVMNVTGLSREFAEAARRRLFTESLSAADRGCLKRLEEVYRGLGYFTHLGRRFLTIGRIPGKAAAVRTLFRLSPLLGSGEAYVMAFGDADMDMEMLEEADEAYVVPSYSPARPNRSDYMLAPMPAPAGWIYLYDKYVKPRLAGLSRGVATLEAAPSQ